MRPGSRLAIILLSAVAVVHVLRLAFRIDLVVGGTVIPLWVSVPAVLVFGSGAFLLAREQRH
ncbi:MAG: hypothetical protein IH877_05650 [Gemmatimonadetes bacterium]|nr:hypothetical protein [Gemmatimonadota bacterium]